MSSSRQGRCWRSPVPATCPTTRQKLPFPSAVREPFGMASGRPITTITLGGRQVAVRRVALRPEEVGRVVGETEGEIIMRLRCRDLAGVLGTASQRRSPVVLPWARSVRCGAFGPQA
jgi:hypothetical protein